MTRAVAINVGANSSLPGFRGPVHPDGSFVYVPIPEREPVADPVPTYADLGLPIAIPEDHRDTPVHLDPEFPRYPRCTAATYGDEHGVKAAPLLELEAGDLLAFYATLRTVDHGAGPAVQPADDPADDHPTVQASTTAADATPDRDDWRPPTWGAYVIGAFVLARDPIPGEAYADLPAADREALSNNAHVKRETVDAAVFVLGDPGRSGLLERALALSAPTAGATANGIVMEWSSDSGKGPWWRRPLRFEGDGAAAFAEALGPLRSD